MSQYVVSRTQRALNDRGRAVKGSAIMLLGLAYKKDVGDTRESPAFPIAKQLLDLGATLSYHDPYLKESPETRAWVGRPALKFVPLTPEQLARHDAIVIVTDHSSVDYAAVLKYSSLIVDSRGVYRGPHEKVVRA
jgi:UDP-N-acetyl-D-glucosamine dehydrogenase